MNTENCDDKMNNVDDILHSVRELRHSSKLISGVIISYDCIKFLKNYLMNNTNIRRVAVIGFNSGNDFTSLQEDLMFR